MDETGIHDSVVSSAKEEVEQHCKGFEGLVNYLAKIGGGSLIKSIENLNEHLRHVRNMMDLHYPGWSKFEHEQGMLPTCCPTWQGPREENDVNVRGSDSELKVFQMFEKLMEETHKMFVIAKLSTEVFDDQERGEIDFLVFSPQKGIIVGEVKSVESITQKVWKGIEQLKKSKRKLINFIQNGLHIEHVDVQLVLLTPNLTSRDFQLKQDSQNVSMMFKEDFEDPQSWWTNIPDTSFHKSSMEQFLNIAASTICRTCTLKEKVRQTTHGIANNLRTQEPAKKMHYLKSYNIHLTVSQYDVWTGPEWQLIFGWYGTGKTLLISHKIKDVQRDETTGCTILFTTLTLTDLYKSWLKKEGHNPEIVLINNDDFKVDQTSKILIVTYNVDDIHKFSFPDKMNSLAKYIKSQKEGKCAVFMDDFGFSSEDRYCEFLCPVLSAVQRQQVDISVFWVTCLGNWDSSASFDSEQLYKSLRKYSLEDYVREKFKISTLNSTMRCSRSVYDFLQELKEDGVHYAPIGHNIEGSPSYQRALVRADFDEIISEAIGIVEKEFKEFSIKRQIAILSENVLVPHLEEILNKRGYNTQPVRGEDDDKIIVDAYSHAQSYEWDFVAAVTFCSHENNKMIAHFACSRAVVKAVAVHCYREDDQYDCIMVDDIHQLTDIVIERAHKEQMDASENELAVLFVSKTAYNNVQSKLAESGTETTTISGHESGMKGVTVDYSVNVLAFHGNFSQTRNEKRLTWSIVFNVICAHFPDYGIHVVERYALSTRKRINLCFHFQPGPGNCYNLTSCARYELGPHIFGIIRPSLTSNPSLNRIAILVRSDNDLSTLRSYFEEKNIATKRLMSDTDEEAVVIDEYDFIRFPMILTTKPPWDVAISVNLRQFMGLPEDRQHCFFGFDEATKRIQILID